MSDFPTLQSKDGTMVVNFYPVKTPYGDIKRHMITEMTLQRLENIAADLYDHQEA